MDLRMDSMPTPPTKRVAAGPSPSAQYRGAMSLSACFGSTPSDSVTGASWRFVKAKDDRSVTVSARVLGASNR